MFRYGRFFTDRFRFDADGGGGGGGDPKTVTLTESELQAKIDAAVSKGVATREKTLKAELDADYSLKLAELQGKIDGYETDKLTSEQKVTKMLDEAKAKHTEALKFKNRVMVESEFVKAGFQLEKDGEPDAALADIISLCVDTDEAKSIAAAKTKIASLSNFIKESAEKIFKMKLDNMPKPKNADDDGKGAGGGDMKLDDFRKLTTQEQIDFKEKNPERYKKLFNIK